MIKNIITSAVTALVVALIVVGLVGGNQSVPSANIKGVTNYDTVQASGLIVGTSTASNFSFVKGGACTLGTLGPASIDASHTASTTKVYDCAFSGVGANDVVLASISTSTVSGAMGWSVAFAKPSTTPNFVEVGIFNGTNASVVPSTQSVGSSTNVFLFRTQSTNQGL